MSQKDIYNTLKNDEAFRHAVDNLHLFDMATILKAYGFSHTVEDACRMFEYCGVLPKLSKD